MEIVVQNQTRRAIDLTLQRTDLQRGVDGNGSIDFVAVGQAPLGAGSWIRIPYPQFQLAAGSQRTVEFVVRAPDDASAGGHYAGIVFTMRQHDPASNVRIDQGAEIPVYFTVVGAAKRDLSVHVSPDAAWKWNGGRTTWRIRLENRGDLHENVSGTVRISGLLGGDRTVQLDSRILFPGERVTQRVESDLRDAPDRYTARATVQRDRARAVVGTSTGLVVAPWWLVALLLVAALVVTWRIRTRRTGPEWDDEIPPG